jgi:hypothetical protein
MKKILTFMMFAISMVCVQLCAVNNLYLINQTSENVTFQNKDCSAVIPSKSYVMVSKDKFPSGAFVTVSDSAGPIANMLVPNGLYSKKDDKDVALVMRGRILNPKEGVINAQWETPADVTNLLKDLKNEGKWEQVSASYASKCELVESTTK